MANVITAKGIVENTTLGAISNTSDYHTESKVLSIAHDELIEALDINFDQFETIVLNFPTHADGRAYTQARLLRDRFGFKGNIRATGDVMYDQLSYMYRCGFSQFELREDQDPAFCLKAFSEISVNLQSCYLKTRPKLDVVTEEAIAA
jgi:uncharacterized protein (DUF934 family)